MTTAIETNELTRGFSSGLAVDNVSISIGSGEVLALLGPNGAGKTTTVRLLNGVLRPDSGSARVLGFNPTLEGEQVRQRTGVLTENAGLDDRLTTRENLEFTARIRGFDRTSAKRRVNEMIERFGMTERADDLTQGFSTGQRKRVALARALLHDPEVLFLDEPTSGLDPAGTRDVIGLIHDLADEGRTIILATHFLGEAGRLADKMAVLHRGRLRAFGSPAELANGMWHGIGAELDLNGPASAATLELIAVQSGVLEVNTTSAGLALRIESREIVPRLVSVLTENQIQIYGIEASAPSLEDVYFEIERRILAESGGASVTDGFAKKSPDHVQPSNNGQDLSKATERKVSS